jgi:hypothetical protein
LIFQSATAISTISSATWSSTVRRLGMEAIGSFRYNIRLSLSGFPPKENDCASVRARLAER